CSLRLNAFSTSGRLSVIVRTAPSRPVSTSAMGRTLLSAPRFAQAAATELPWPRMGLTFVSDPPPADEAALDAYSQAVAFVADPLSPSVANLRVSRRVRGGRMLDGGGSGVVITPDGYLLTSAHVVARTEGRGLASFPDGRELEFTVVGA